MKNIIKCISMLICFSLCMTGLSVYAATTPTQGAKTLQLSEAEQSLVAGTQNGEPLSIGIIPHTFPLSECPPEAPEYAGINVEMLAIISELSGLQFEYSRIPLEKQTPYQLLQEETVDLVAGTIKLDTFLQNPNLVLSSRLSDGSAACFAKRSTNPSILTTGKIAVMSGYQAGFEFSAELFPAFEIVTYPSNQEVMRAIRNNAADFAIVSRYVGIYELQNPMNENLTELSMYKMEKDSCVMGINTPQNQIAISIINKALDAIGNDGYNFVQMNFSLMNPYRMSISEIIYKYRYFLMLACVAIIGFLFLTIRLYSTQKERERLSLDPLTGALSEAGFKLATTNVLFKASKPLFITAFDISHFSNYNELHGKAQGDELLKNIVKIVKSLLCEQDIICRSYADHFIALSSKDKLENLISDINIAIDRFNEIAQSNIALKFGVYPVTDTTVSISKMLDFAAMAKKQFKDNPKINIGVFNEDLLTRHVSELKMISTFKDAILHKEFVAYYQPKFDTTQKTIIGAEALVRWVSDDGTLIPPVQFIELFEKGGQIQHLDFYMLEQVCIFLNSLIAQKIPVLPIAVNFSRVHLYSDEFIQKLNQIVEQYGIAKHLIEIECTETTILNNIDLTRECLGRLQEQGFSIAMDDFGSAYSSLNTLSSIPLDVLKLDRGFLLATLSHEKAKAKIIIRSVINLAHDLSLKVVAEGVETESQYQFLKNLGCDFIQGYYFSKPLTEPDFLELLIKTNHPSEYT